MDRLLRFTVLGVTALALEGCTLLGAGVGAGIDSAVPGPHEQREPDQVSLKRGDHVVLVTRAGTRVEGRYAGVFGPSPRDPEAYLMVDGDDGLAHVAASDLRSVGVEVTGRGWLWGGIVGLALDIVVVTALIAAKDDWSMGNYAGTTGCGWGC